MVHDYFRTTIFSSIVVLSCFMLHLWLRIPNFHTFMLPTTCLVLSCLVADDKYYVERLSPPKLFHSAFYLALQYSNIAAGKSIETFTVNFLAMLLPESKSVSQSDSGCSSFSASSLSLASFFSYSGETWANSLLHFGQILICNQLIRYIVAMEHNCKTSQFEGRWNSCYDSKLSHNHGTPSSCNITVFCSVLDGIVGLGFLRPFQVPGIHVEFIVDHGSIHGACATILGVKSRDSSVLPGVHNKIPSGFNSHCYYPNSVVVVLTIATITFFLGA